MKTYYYADKFDYGTDNSMKRYKNIISKQCGDKCNMNKMINRNKIDSSLCAIIPTRQTTMSGGDYKQRIENL